MRFHFLLLSFILCLAGTANSQTICLDSRCGAKWMAKVEGIHEPFPVSVPGYWPTGTDTNAIWSDALQQQFSRFENSAVEYYCDFFIHDRFLGNASIELITGGIDLFAEVTLNGKPVWRKTDNMFVRREAEIKKYLRQGINRLSFNFLPLAEGFQSRNPHREFYPADNEETQEKFGPFVRKAPYQFGWDFAPRAVVPGIWRSVKMVGHSGRWITAVQQDSLTLSAEKADLVFTVNYKNESAFKGSLCAGWIQSNGDTLIETQQAISHQGGNIYEVAKAKLRLTIPDPQLWWPTGHGEAHLYSFVFVLKNEMGQTVSAMGQRTGLRTVELVQENDIIGKSFFFRVNGKPIFAQGANYIPPSVFPNQEFLPGQSPRDMFETFREGHFNMVRVWGGGVYPSDAFYDLADEFGILIWQDFMFACAMYDQNSFAVSFTDELTQTIHRLKHHPSLALWCGNNEIQVAWHNWGWQEKYKISADNQRMIWEQYRGLFESYIPMILMREDPSRPYVSTSPLSNWGKAEDFLSGDNHYWGVYHGDEPFEAYQTHVPRFASEYGFQSFPTPQTFRQFVPESKWSLDSPAVARFQKSYKGNGLLVKYMENELGFVPKDFYNFMLLTQTLQAQAYEKAILAHRAATGHCMGTLYWQFNDCWPGITWSTIDYLGAPKASWYAVRSAMNPVKIIPADQGDTLNLFVLNGRQQPADFTLDLTIYRKKKIQAQFHSARNVTSGRRSLFNTLHFANRSFGKKRNQYLFALLREDEEHYDSLIHYFVPVQDLKLSRPKVTAVVVQRTGEPTVIELRSRNLVKDLWLDFVSTGDKAVIPSDNHVDLLPGKVQRITLPENAQWSEVRLSSLFERRKNKQPFLVIRR